MSTLARCITFACALQRATAQSIDSLVGDAGRQVMVGESPGRGLGLFAVQNFEENEVVFKVNRENIIYWQDVMEYLNNCELDDFSCIDAGMLLENGDISVSYLWLKTTAFYTYVTEVASNTPYAKYLSEAVDKLVTSEKNLGNNPWLSLAPELLFTKQENFLIQVVSNKVLAALKKDIDELKFIFNALDCKKDTFQRFLVFNKVILARIHSCWSFDLNADLRRETCLVQLMDLMNSDDKNYQNTKCDTNNNDINQILCRATRSLEAGEELLVQYEKEVNSRSSDAELNVFLTYGFINGYSSLDYGLRALAQQLGTIILRPVTWIPG